jgi:hypothetical protein
MRMNVRIVLEFNMHTNVQIMLNFNIICTFICVALQDYFIAVSFKVFGCELPENGDQLQRAEPRSGEKDISKIFHLLENIAFVGNNGL